MNWLLLILCGLLVGFGIVVLRTGSRRRTTTWGLSLWVGLAPLIVVAPFTWRYLELFSWWYAGLMMLAGALAIVGVWASAEALRRGPTGPTFMIQNFSLSVPIIGSLIFYGESLSATGPFGLAAVAVAIPLLALRRRVYVATDVRSHVGPAWLAYVVVTFVASGAAGMLLRDAPRQNPATDFLMGTVLLAYVGNNIGSVIGMGAARCRPTRADFLWGSAVGLLNFACFIIIMPLLRDMGAVIVYPTRFIVTTVIVVAASLFVFKEPLDMRTAAGLVLGVAGVILLSIA